MKTLFPTFNLNNISLFYLLAIFLNGWFVLPNWAFYYGQYISRSQIGLIEGMSILIGILMEVPAGVITDFIGKKKALILGSVFIGLSTLVLILFPSFTGFLIGNTCMFIGFAFHSGTIEAFGYDTLVEHKLEKNYDVVIGKYTALSLIATVISTIGGGFLFKFHPTFPFIAWGIFMIISIAIAFLSREPRVDTVKFSFDNYINQFIDGSKTLFSKPFHLYLVPIIGITCFVNLYQGLVRQSIAAYFTLNGETFGYVLGITTLIVSVFAYKFDAIKKFLGEKKLLVISLAVFFLAFSFPLVVPPIAGIGVLFFVTINFAEKFAKPLISVLVNERTSSKHRVTTLSTLAFLGQIPYIILVTFFASLTALENISSLFMIFAGMIGVVFVYSFGLFSLRKNKGLQN